MDRIIQPYAGPGPAARPATAATPAHPFATLSPTAIGPAHHGHGHAGSKSAGDYLRALRRRFWPALAVAAVVVVAGAVVVVRQEAIYRTTAQIHIEAPKFDMILTNLVSEHEVGRADPGADEKYVPNRLVTLRSPALAAEVVLDPRLGPAPAGVDDPAQAVVDGLSYRRYPGADHIDVHLEGPDPRRIAATLNLLLERFREKAKREIDERVDNTKTYAETSLRRLRQDLGTIDGKIAEALRDSPQFSPNGENLLESRYETLTTLLTQKEMRLDELERDVQMARLFRRDAPVDRQATPAQIKMEKLLDTKAYWDERLREARRTIHPRRFNSDPAARLPAEKLHAVMDEIRAIQPQLAPPDPTGEGDPATAASIQLLDGARGDIERLRERTDETFGQMQQSTPQYQRYRALLDERTRKADAIATMEQRLTEFEMLASTQNRPVEIVQTAAEPTVPVRPRRALSLAIVAALAMMLGLAVALGLEHLDRSVTVPEQLAAGLSVPLLGVIPRMRRTARLQRGGHLWTIESPGSAEADAYRNLRAGLLGLACPTGKPVVTILISSARSGEGKSTTALNLATTCARAGERTVLVDVDLRRPSLAEAFGVGGAPARGERPRAGLVDVLRDGLAWQRTLVRSPLATLDFIPAGDVAEVPVEVLGSREMKQLLEALSGHYDRVILDGPAILGLADCAMLGRMADATFMVVRSGAGDLRPLERARAMLERSRVAVAGVVFNALAEDYASWSSHGAPLGPPTRGLDAAPQPRAAAWATAPLGA